jgi:hypothetical protein
MKYRAVPVLMLAIAALAAGCSSQEGNEYPARYLAAVETTAGVAVRPEHLEPFIGFITHMGSDDWADHFKGVYAEQLHFSDTLALISSRDALQAYFDRLHNADTTVAVRVLSRQISDRNAYLVWEMTSTFAPVIATRRSHTIGMTHLRFNEAGQVILHQDFWDAAQGFYQHVPVLGAALRTVRGQVQP